MNELLIFDLDNTLLAGDSDRNWGIFLSEQQIVDESYLEMKHDRYNACQEEEKLDYAKNNHSSMNIQVDTDESGEDTHNY